MDILPKYYLTDWQCIEFYIINWLLTFYSILSNNKNRLIKEKLNLRLPLFTYLLNTFWF